MKIIRKKIAELSDSQIEKIDCFLTSHYCTVFHEPDFNKIVSDVFGTMFSYGLVYDDEGKLVALCPFHSMKDALLTRTYSNPALYDVRYGGWVYDENKISMLELLNKLTPFFGESLTYWSVPQIGSDAYQYIDKKTAFQTGIIDLSLSEDDILYKCVTRKRRETIRSSSRKGVVVEELRLTNIDVFIAQCDYLKTSVGLRAFPRDYFTKLLYKYHSKRKMAVFASGLGEHYLASGAIIGNKHLMHLWIAGKPKEIRTNVPRQDLLVWQAIKWAKEAGSRYFDLCVVESERLPNIAKFKLGFSKRTVPFYLHTRKSISYRLISRLQGCLASNSKRP